MATTVIYQQLPYNYYSSKYFQSIGNTYDDVRYTKPELLKVMLKYKKITDCLEGSDAIKGGKEIYLPVPKNISTTKDQDRYDTYLERAVFYCALQQTSMGLIGQCFIYDPEIVVPEELEEFIKNVDGNSDINQFAKKAIGNNINFCRGGIFVDYPSINNNNITKEESDKIQPVMINYNPEQIINWKSKMVDGRIKLSKVVLAECHDSDKSEFEDDYSESWRELYIDDDGLYSVRIWVLNKDDGKTYIKNVYSPMVDGKRLTFIPFQFMGSETNSPDISMPHFDSIANINIGHYRNSADYEDSCFMVGQPTPVFAGLTEEWVETVLKGKVQLGSRGSIPLPIGGEAYLLQATPNIMPFEAMKHKEQQMLSLGAKLIQPSNVARTATETITDKSDESSILTCTSKNTSEAITQCLKWAYLFKTGKEATTEIKYKLRTETALMNMTSNERMQTVSDWQAGAITWTELRDQYKKAGIAFEDIKEPKMPTTEIATSNNGDEKKGTINKNNGRNFIGNKFNE